MLISTTTFAITALPAASRHGWPCSHKEWWQSGPGCVCPSPQYKSRNLKDGFKKSKITGACKITVFPIIFPSIHDLIISSPPGRVKTKMAPRDVWNGVDAPPDAVVDDSAEKRFGTLMVLLLVVALPLNYFFSLLALINASIVLFISGNVIRGCCCSAKQYTFEPHVRKWAKAIAGGLAFYSVLWLSLTFYYDVGFLPHKGGGGGSSSSSGDDNFSLSQTVATVLSYACLLVALIFSILFTWGKKWTHIVT